MNIFVSYTTRNNEVDEKSLLALSEKLKFFGNVFIDMLNNDSNDKQKRVIAELQQADLLVLIKTKSIQYSEWVKYEIETARRIKMPIIEMSIEELELISRKDIATKINQVSHIKPILA